MKYKFIGVSKWDKWSEVSDSKVVVEVETDGLEELIQHFEYFLKGCSFSLRGRRLVLTEEEGDES